MFIESRGMSQQDLADKAGINKRMIQAYEQGYRSINGAKLTTLVTFCLALECHLSEIVEDAQLVKELKAYEATPYCPNCGADMRREGEGGT